MTLLSAKVLNRLEKTVMIAENSLLWRCTTLWAIPFNKGAPYGGRHYSVD